MTFLFHYCGLVLKKKKKACCVFYTSSNLLTIFLPNENPCWSSVPAMSMCRGKALIYDICNYILTAHDLILDICNYILNYFCHSCRWGFSLLISIFQIQISVTDSSLCCNFNFRYLQFNLSPVLKIPKNIRHSFKSKLCMNHFKLLLFKYYKSQYL